MPRAAPAARRGRARAAPAPPPAARAVANVRSGSDSASSRASASFQSWPGQQERDAARPEAGRAVDARDPAVGLVVVRRPRPAAGRRRAAPAGRAGARSAVCSAAAPRLRGGQARAEGLGHRVDLSWSRASSSRPGAVEPGLVAPLDLAQQVGGGVAAALALEVGGEPHQRGRRRSARSSVARQRSGARRVAAVHAPRVGLAERPATTTRRCRPAARRRAPRRRAASRRGRPGGSERSSRRRSGDRPVAPRPAPAPPRPAGPAFSSARIQSSSSALVAGEERGARLAQRQGVGRVGMGVGPPHLLVGQRALLVPGQAGQRAAAAARSASAMRRGRRPSARPRPRPGRAYLRARRAVRPGALGRPLLAHLSSAASAPASRPARAGPRRGGAAPRAPARLQGRAPARRWASGSGRGGRRRWRSAWRRGRASRPRSAPPTGRRWSRPRAQRAPAAASQARRGAPAASRPHLQPRAREATFLAASTASKTTSCAPRASGGTRSSPTERLVAASQRSGTGGPSPRRAESTITSSSVRTATRTRVARRAPRAGASGRICGRRPSSTKCFVSVRRAPLRVAQHDAHRVASVLRGLPAPGSGPPTGACRAGVTSGSRRPNGNSATAETSAGIALHAQHRVARLDAARPQQRARRGQEGRVGRHELVALGERDDLVDPLALLALGLDQRQQVVDARARPAPRQVARLERLLRQRAVEPRACRPANSGEARLEAQAGPRARRSGRSSPRGCPPPAAGPAPGRRRGGAARRRSRGNGRGPRRLRRPGRLRRRRWAIRRSKKRSALDLGGARRPARCADAARSASGASVARDDGEERQPAARGVERRGGDARLAVGEQHEAAALAGQAPAGGQRRRDVGARPERPRAQRRRAPPRPPPACAGLQAPPRRRAARSKGTSAKRSCGRSDARSRTRWAYAVSRPDQRWLSEVSNRTARVRGGPRRRRAAPGGRGRPRRGLRRAAASRAGRSRPSRAAAPTAAPRVPARRRRAGAPSGLRKAESRSGGASAGTSKRTTRSRSSRTSRPGTTSSPPSRVERQRTFAGRPPRRPPAVTRTASLRRHRRLAVGRRQRQAELALPADERHLLLELQLEALGRRAAGWAPPCTEKSAPPEGRPDGGPSPPSSSSSSPCCSRPGSMRCVVSSR